MGEELAGRQCAFLAVYGVTEKNEWGFRHEAISENGQGFKFNSYFYHQGTYMFSLQKG